MVIKLPLCIVMELVVPNYIISQSNASGVEDKAFPNPVDNTWQQHHTQKNDGCMIKIFAHFVKF